MTKVIIADDDASIRKMGTFLIESAIPGAEVIQLDCGNALEQLLQIATMQGKDVADIVITDNDMLPGKTGLELVGEYAGKEGCPPMILYSGNGNIEQEAMDAGATHFILKGRDDCNAGSILSEVLKR